MSAPLVVLTDGAGPVGDQIVAQLTDAVRSGRLPVGTRLPTVRALAEELGVAVNTIAKAYRRLEAEAIVETNGRHGTTVAPLAADAGVERAAVALAQTARDAGLSLEEATGLLRRVW